MHVTVSMVSKIRISDMVDLDPIEVYLEDFSCRQGKVIITCFGKSWTAFWGGMSSGTKVDQFFKECNNDYLIGCLAPQLPSEVNDMDAVCTLARKRILTDRRGKRLDKNKAREQYEEASSLASLESDGDVEFFNRSMLSFFGDEWWHDMPTKPNPDYLYLERIVTAVKIALQQQEPASSQPAAISV